MGMDEWKCRICGTHNMDTDMCENCGAYRYEDYDAVADEEE